MDFGEALCACVELLHAVARAGGATARNYIGWLLHGTWGGIVAGALFTLPSLVILVGLSWTYMAFGDVPAVASVLYGIKPAVTVRFVGAWGEQVFGPEALATAGIIGAGVATFFTFLLSFLFILIGGPLVEATHGDLKFTAPLTAITAAVVGVVLNLAVFFAVHVLWPEGFARPFEGVAALIGAAAFLAMWRFQWGIIPVIGACGAAGLAATYLR